MDRLRFEIQCAWDGGPLHRGEWARVALEMDGGRGTLAIAIEAADYGDPAPPSPPGAFPGLWEYEVVELFLLGEDERYLELEFGPHGHFLALWFHGERRRVDSNWTLTYRAERLPGRWAGQATISLEALPPGVHAFNGYAIHGQGAARRYLAASPVPGAEPDFHQLQHFRALAEGELGSG